MQGKNRIRIINEIIKVLIANAPEDYVTIPEITQKISDLLDIDANPRTIKQYVQDIKNDLEYPLQFKQGRDGGVRLSEQARKLIATLSHISLTSEEKNALNDAFEIAEKSLSFYYYKDLQVAREKLYLRFNLKEQDFEYYLGHNQSKRKFETKLIKDIKWSIVERKWIELSFKYKSYGISLEMNKYKPMYVVHDSDESFVIIRDASGCDHCQNILNIKNYKITDKECILYKKPPIEKFVNSHTIKAKGEHNLSFEITDELGYEMYDTWNYEFEEINSKENYKEIVFYEKYRVFEFLLRMQSHIKNLKCDDNVAKQWNDIIGNLKNI